MTKLEMIELLQRGEFGNHLRQWSSWSHYQADIATIRGMADRGMSFSLRTKIRNGPFIASVNPLEMSAHDFDSFYLCENDQNMPRMLQGEVREEIGRDDWFDVVPGHWRAVLSTERDKNMRQAMLTPFHVSGLAARCWCRHYMDDHSWHNLLRLFEQWPGHAVEFTVYDKPLGCLRWNTVFWEVRDY